MNVALVRDMGLESLEEKLQSLKDTIKSGDKGHIGDYEYSNMDSAAINSLFNKFYGQLNEQIPGLVQPSDIIYVRTSMYPEANEGEIRLSDPSYDDIKQRHNIGGKFVDVVLPGREYVFYGTQELPDVGSKGDITFLRFRDDEGNPVSADAGLVADLTERYMHEALMTILEDEQVNHSVVSQLADDFLDNYDIGVADSIELVREALAREHPRYSIGGFLDMSSKALDFGGSGKKLSVKSNNYDQRNLGKDIFVEEVSPRLEQAVLDAEYAAEAFDEVNQVLRQYFIERIDEGKYRSNIGFALFDDVYDEIGQRFGMTEEIEYGRADVLKYFIDDYTSQDLLVMDTRIFDEKLEGICAERGQKDKLDQKRKSVFRDFVDVIAESRDPNFIKVPSPIDILAEAAGSEGYLAEKRKDVAGELKAAGKYFASGEPKEKVDIFLDSIDQDSNIISTLIGSYVDSVMGQGTILDTWGYDKGLGNMLKDKKRLNDKVETSIAALSQLEFTLNGDFGDVFKLGNYSHDLGVDPDEDPSGFIERFKEKRQRDKIDYHSTVKEIASKEVRKYLNFAKAYFQNQNFDDIVKGCIKFSADEFMRGSAKDCWLPDDFDVNQHKAEIMTGAVRKLADYVQKIEADYIKEKRLN